MWCAPTGQNTTVNCALWSQTSGTAGVVIPGTIIPSTTLTPGQWNFIPITTPVQLAIGDCLIAAVGWNSTTGNGFPDTNTFWPTSQGSMISNGPLLAWGGAGTLYMNGGTGNNFATAQGCFSSTSSVASTTMPAQASGTDNFWVDVSVSNTAPANYAGTYRLWPNMQGVDAGTAGDNAVDYVIATEIHLTQRCTVNNIWAVSVSGAANLPTQCDVWSSQGLSGSNVSSFTPTWLTPTGGVGVAGGGWLKAAVPSLVLQPGTYKFSVYNANGTVGSWGAKRLGYWGWGAAVPVQSGPAASTGAPGIAGITSGPLYAPPSTLAGTAFSYSPASGNPTEPGQSIFASVGTDVFPNLYVGVNSVPQTSGTGALFQNYWIDVEVTPVPSNIPQGYSESHIIQVYGSPLNYQVDGYLISLGASANQRALIAAHANATQGTIYAEDVTTILTNNA